MLINVEIFSTHKEPKVWATRTDQDGILLHKGFDEVVLYLGKLVGETPNRKLPVFNLSGSVVDFVETTT
jgi:hypothetical protein